MLLQLIHLLLAALSTYWIVGQLKWKKIEAVKVRGIDGVVTVLLSLSIGTGLVWVLGWLAGFAGVNSGLNWLVGGLASYAVCGLLHEWFKDKPGKADEHGKP